MNRTAAPAQATRTCDAFHDAPGPHPGCAEFATTPHTFPCGGTAAARITFRDLAYVAATGDTSTDTVTLCTPCAAEFRTEGIEILSDSPVCSGEWSDNGAHTWISLTFGGALSPDSRLGCKYCSATVTGVEYATSQGLVLVGKGKAAFRLHRVDQRTTRGIKVGEAGTLAEAVAAAHRIQKQRGHRVAVWSADGEQGLYLTP